MKDFTEKSFLELIEASKTSVEADQFLKTIFIKEDESEISEEVGKILLMTLLSNQSAQEYLVEKDWVEEICFNTEARKLFEVYSLQYIVSAVSGNKYSVPTLVSVCKFGFWYSEEALILLVKNADENSDCFSILKGYVNSSLGAAELTLFECATNSEKLLKFLKSYLISNYDGTGNVELWQKQLLKKQYKQLSNYFNIFEVFIQISIPLEEELLKTLIKHSLEESSFAQFLNKYLHMLKNEAKINFLVDSLYSLWFSSTSRLSRLYQDADLGNKTSLAILKSFAEMDYSRIKITEDRSYYLSELDFSKID